MGRGACDINSRAELDSIKRLAERWTRLDELVLSFEDSVRINGPAELVYDFLYRVGDWPDLIPTSPASTSPRTAPASRSCPWTR